MTVGPVVASKAEFDLGRRANPHSPGLIQLTRTRSLLVSNLWHNPDFSLRNSWANLAGAQEIFSHAPLQNDADWTVRAGVTYILATVSGRHKSEGLKEELIIWSVTTICCVTWLSILPH